MSKDEIVIDLTDKSLNERLYTDFSYKVNRLLLDLYDAGVNINPTIRGTQAQIESFFKALRGEKRYMDSYIRHGLSDSRTMTNRRDLDRAVSGFEKETGLRWPFKN
tara:strand:- start:10105 stop:10422 length:318 start_codon:yes stop_codon:yes gene_type:complete